MSDIFNAIVHAPLSIVGNANFTSMEQLDGDRFPLVSSRGGGRCARDVVQFVPFIQFKQQRGGSDGLHNVDALASETLREIPNQVQQYFAMKQVAPNPAVEVAIPTREVAVPVAHVVAPPPSTAAMVGRQLFRTVVDLDYTD